MLEKIEAKLAELEADARYVPEPIKELLRLIGLEHDGVKPEAEKPAEPAPVAPAPAP